MNLHLLLIASIWILLLWYLPVTWSIAYLCTYSFCVILGVFLLSIWGHMALSSPHQTSLFLLERTKKEIREVNEILKDDQSNWPFATKKSHLPVIFGRTVDCQLQLLIDNILRDFVVKWFRELTHNPEPVVEKFKEHLWDGIQNLHERLLRIDAEKLLASDMVLKITQHFEKLRIAQSCAMELNQPPVFAMCPHLMAPETELHYLRQVSELILMYLMPRSYSLTPPSHLMVEVIACKVLQPAINLLTDPDYINQKIVHHLEAQKELDAMSSRTHEHAKTLDDYIALINACDSVDTLKRLRYDLVTQIMQATTLENVKRAKGLDLDAAEKPGHQRNISKQQIADARTLSRYISQLTVAKAECERALKQLGWDGAFPTVDTNEQSIQLQTVLESPTGRRRLSSFLESLCSQGLVGFWAAVEELRASPRRAWHQLGADIFYTYVRSPSAEIKVDKETRKRMEAFLLGDRGPEVFYEVQEAVVETLHDKYYPAFLLSDEYRAMCKELDIEEANKAESASSSPLEEARLAEATEAGALPLNEHSTYARRKLEVLHERHRDKVQALAALKASLKPESRALGVLAAEAERLAGERRRLEAHLARTDTWAEHLGRWRATVHSAEIVDESKPPHFVIVVHMASREEPADARPEEITTGWVLLRTLAELQELHRKLRPLCTELKNCELPSNSFKSLFAKSDRNTLDKAKNLVQKYLEFVLEDERLNQCEAVYAFLNPSSECLKPADLPKKAKFSFSHLFKSSGASDASGRSSQEREPAADDLSLSLDAAGDARPPGNNHRGGGVGSEERDSIAEPLYALLSEVFDMRGVFRWLRKTLVTFVQITYGRTINRQIKDTITWIFSEQMLHYYIGCALKSWWPGGALSLNTVNRNDQDKEHTRTLARTQLTECVSAAAASLVGAAAAARGAHTLFRALQNDRHNKQLFYELLELVLIEVFPELKRYQ